MGTCEIFADIYKNIPQTGKVIHIYHIYELFTLKHVYSFRHLVFENTLIEFVENHKHLVLTLSNTGKWNCHIDNIAKASSKKL